MLPKRTRFDIGSAARPLYVTPFREGLALKPVLAVLGIVLDVLCAGLAGGSIGRSADRRRADRPTANAGAGTAQSARIPQAVERLNAWTVGLAGGQLEGAPIRFATEIARVVDDGDNLHVLPIVTRGPVENVEALLYLKGVDAAIINSDALDQFKTLVPNIRQRITYILSLFPSELHIFVRPEIKSLNDLRARRSTSTPLALRRPIPVR